MTPDAASNTSLPTATPEVVAPQQGPDAAVETSGMMTAPLVSPEPATPAETSTEFRNQRICAACGLVFTLLLMIGFSIAGFIPPPPPVATAAEVAARFREDALSIRLGFVCTMLGAAFIPAWCVALYTQLRHIKGQGAALPMAQMCAGLLNALLFMLPAMFWEITAYRADTRSFEATQTLNDIATIIFICPFSFGLTQGFAIALAILQDDDPEPVFPRWVAYFNIWCVLVFAAGALTPFFKTGPFAWDGMFAYWVPLSVYCGWFVVMYFAMMKTIRRREFSTLGPGVRPAAD